MNCTKSVYWKKPFKKPLIKTKSEPTISISARESKNAHNSTNSCT